MIRKTTFCIEIATQSQFMAKHRLSFSTHVEKASQNQRCFFVDGAKCDTKINLFKHFFHVFNFPDYFGKNWDAFNDSFSDFDWFEGTFFEIFIINPLDILKNDKLDRDIFWEILSEIDKRNDPSNPNEELEHYLHFVLQSEPLELKSLQNLLDEVKIKYVTLAL